MKWCVMERAESANFGRRIAPGISSTGRLQIAGTSSTPYSRAVNVMKKAPSGCAGLCHAV